MFSFSFPILFLLVPIIIIIWYTFFRERFGMLHPNPLIAKYLKTPKKIWLLWCIRTLMLTSLISILVGTTLTQTRTTKVTIPQDIMIVFDISLSMLAEDITPNRIEVAKNVVRNFILSRTSDRIGLVIFAGKPFVSVPFSTDYVGINSIIRGLSPQLIRQDLPGLSGTNIGDAILLANMLYSGSKSPEKSIVLLTDGRANIGIDPLTAAGESRNKSIKIYPIGIGSLNKNELSYTDSYGQKKYFYDSDGTILKSDLDETMMKKIAGETGGKYFHADNRSQLEQVFTDIGKNLPMITENKTETKAMNLAPIFIILFGILLAMDVTYTRYLLRKYRLL